MLGLTAKGGVSDDDIFTYFKNNIVALYLDAEDAKGRQVKVDSGPGCMFVALVTYARNLGFVTFTSICSCTK